MRIPGLSGLEVLETIQQTWPQIAGLILTTYDENEFILRGFQEGASGYLLKESALENLFHTIRAAACGEVILRPEIMRRVLAHTMQASHAFSPLHPASQTIPGHRALIRREQEVLAGVVRGERSKEIARRLGITERTVRAYPTSIYTRLNVDSPSATVAIALKHGLLPLLA